MIAILRIEAIGDDFVYRNGRLKAAGKDLIPAHMRRVAHYLAAGKPWCARITGLDPRFGLRREFVRCKRDYKHANSTGSRGVILHYELRPGIYEVNERTSWKSERRYFVRSHEGRLTEVNLAEVKTWVQEQGR
jgi:hypothetical protein